MKKKKKKKKKRIKHFRLFNIAYNFNVTNYPDFYKVQSTRDISNTDISTNPLIAKKIVWTYFLFYFIVNSFSQTTDILRKIFWDQKNLLGDISSFGRALTLKYQGLTAFNGEIFV